MTSQTWLGAFESHQAKLKNYVGMAEELSGSRKVFQNLKTEEELRLLEIDKTLDRYSQVVQLLQLVAEKAQYQIVKVEKICTDALRDILGDVNISFKFKMEKKKNCIDTTFYVHDMHVGDVNLMKGEAGGTKNVVAVGLRLIFAELYNPKIDGPIILDEAGGNISTDYQESFGRFLKKFSELTGRQIILVSHHKPVISQATRRITVNKAGGESFVTILQEN